MLANNLFFNKTYETNVLLINLNDTTSKAIFTDDASKLVDSPVSTGQFIAAKEVFILSEKHYIVRLTELYPVSGRIWINTYNLQVWQGWKSIV